MVTTSDLSQSQESLRRRSDDFELKELELPKPLEGAEVVSRGNARLVDIDGRLWQIWPIPCSIQTPRQLVVWGKRVMGWWSDDEAAFATRMLETMQANERREQEQSIRERKDPAYAFLADWKATGESIRGNSEFKQRMAAVAMAHLGVVSSDINLMRFLTEINTHGLPILREAVADLIRVPPADSNVIALLPYRCKLAAEAQRMMHKTGGDK